MKKNFFAITLLLLTSALSAYGGNRLEVVKLENNTFKIQFSNAEEVAGLQFRLHTSSDIELGILQRDNRTSDSHWIVATNRLDNSTLNVLILSLDRKNFPVGEGTLASISFSQTNPSNKSFALLEEACITKNIEKKPEIMTRDIEWSNNLNSDLSNCDSKLFSLGQNYPNPFNPTTRITYSISKAAQVKLSVYDIAGREINRLIDQNQDVGNYSVEWNSNINGGAVLASGVYFVRLNVGNESLTRKVLLTK